MFGSVFLLIFLLASGTNGDKRPFELLAKEKARLQAAIAKGPDQGKYLEAFERAAAGDTGSGPVLIEALHHPEPLVAYQAGRYLGWLGVREAVEPLISVLRNSKDKGVRQGAVIGLGHLRDPRSLEPLIAAMSEYGTGVSLLSASALGKLNDERAVPALNEYLAHAEGPARVPAVDALAKIPGTSAKIALEKEVRNSRQEDLKEDAARYLLRRDPKNAVALRYRSTRRTRLELGRLCTAILRHERQEGKAPRGATAGEIARETEEKDLTTKDGWDNEIIIREAENGLKLISSGEDGETDTVDDIVIDCGLATRKRNRERQSGD